MVVQHSLGASNYTSATGAILAKSNRIKASQTGTVDPDGSLTSSLESDSSAHASDDGSRHNALY